MSTLFLAMLLGAIGRVQAEEAEGRGDPAADAQARRQGEAKSSPCDGPSSARMTILIEEYRALRGEIQTKMTTRPAVSTIFFTAIFAIIASTVGLASDPKRQDRKSVLAVFLVVPFLILLERTYSYSVDVDIMRLGRYLCTLENVLRKLCAPRTGSGELLGWEHYLAEHPVRPDPELKLLILLLSACTIVGLYGVHHWRQAFPLRRLALIVAVAAQIFVIWNVWHLHRLVKQERQDVCTLERVGGWPTTVCDTEGSHLVSERDFARITSHWSTSPARSAHIRRHTAQRSRVLLVRSKRGRALPLRRRARAWS